MSATAHASRASREPVEWLDGTGLDVARLGGKGALLARLARAGFRIPPGSCLTAEALATRGVP